MLLCNVSRTATLHYQRIFGSGGIGKTSIVEDMSRMCGQLMHTLVCSKMTKMETNAMNGLAMTGIWLVFDKFNSMPNNIMTMATNIAEKYLLAKHLKCKTHSNDGEVQIMNFNADGAILSIMNPILRVNTEREFPSHSQTIPALHFDSTESKDNLSSIFHYGRI